MSKSTKSPGGAESRCLHALVQRLGEADRILREVGHEMRKERERRKVSLQSLAKQLGCSAPFLSDMERGDRKYSIDRCRKALAILALNTKLTDDGA